MNAADFQAAGLYDPASPKAAERLELLEWLDSRGVPLEAMQRARAEGRLSAVAQQNVLRKGPFLTQVQLAERLGVEPELIEAFRVCFAIPPTPPDAGWCNEDEARMFEAVALGIGALGEEQMLRLTRVLGASVSRIAEAMVSMNAEVIGGLHERGATELEIAKQNLVVSEAAHGPSRIMTGLLSIHLQVAARRLWKARALSGEAGTVYGCVGFVDLVGSTTLSRNLSVDELSATVDRFEAVAHDVAINGGGRVVKFIGDEVMFVTSDAGAGCEIALALVEAFAGDDAVTPRGGLAEGALLDRCGDYYGPVVNLAARLAEIAVPREVLVTAGVAAKVAAGRIRTESAGRRNLRGFEEPVPLVSIARGAA